MHRVPKRLNATILVALAILVLVVSAHAQMTIGDDLTLKLSGNFGVGVSGTNSSLGTSAHSTGFNGNGSLTGNYYHPSFISFSVQPYLNRSSSDSEIDSRNDSRGLLSSVQFFNGSFFPGSVSYSRDRNSTGEFGLPGVGTLATEGEAQNLAVNWSLLLPDKPTLQAGFSTGSSNSRIIGVNDGSSGSSKNWNLTSTYTLKGFNLRGHYFGASTDSELPGFLSGGILNMATDSRGYGVQAGRTIPMSGSWSAGWDRNSYSNATSGSSDTNGASENLYSNVTLNPFSRLAVSGDIRYTTNVVGAFRQNQLGGASGLLPEDPESNSLTLNSTAHLTIFHGLGLQGYVTRRYQSFYDQDVNVTQYGGTLTFNYTRPLLGMLRFNFGLVNTATEKGNQGVGIVSSVGMTRRFGRWELSSDFSYAQRVATLLSVYTTSNYNFGGSLRRKLNDDTYWSVSARSARSGLTLVEGASNNSESYSTTLGWKRYAFNATYSTSAGTSVLGAGGVLQPVAVDGLPVDNLLLSNGRAFGFGISASPMRRLNISGHYSRVFSETESGAVFSVNRASRYDSRMEYKVRRLSFRGGYRRYDQNVSAISAIPTVVNSYYFGISRWFDIF